MTQRQRAMPVPASGTASATVPVRENALAPASRMAAGNGDAAGHSPSADLLLWLLDEIDIAIGIISHDGTVIYMNRGMNAIAEAQDGLSLSRNRLCGAEIQAALVTTQKNAPQDGRAFRVPRPSGAKPYHCLLKPITTGPREPKAFVLFTADADRSKLADPKRIVELFGVTNQEARIASLLAAGARLDEASSRMGISIGTGRFHLKNLLGKTATSRQAELSQLINGLFDKIC